MKRQLFTLGLILAIPYFVYFNTYCFATEHHIQPAPIAEEISVTEPKDTPSDITPTSINTLNQSSEFKDQSAMHSDQLEHFIVSLKINYEDSDIITIALKNAVGDLLMPMEVLPQFNVKQDYLATALFTIDGKEYVNLNHLKKATYHLNSNSLSLEINFPAEGMNAQSINDIAITKTKSAGKPANGVYMNYDITATNNQTSKYVSGLEEVTWFNAKGVINNSFFLQRQVDGTKFENNNQSVRLETNWTVDHKENMASWRTGDSITRAASWSSSTRFAGLQYATNFAVRPDLITHPLENFKGTAYLPSTLDIYANSLLLYHGKVNTGDFNINNIPVTNGRGDLVVEVKDITGKVQTITVPYYSVPTMLKGGLSDFSFESGVQRQAYAIKSNDYAGFVTNADYMHGVSDNWTSGAHFESYKNFATTGITNNVKLGNYGIITGSVATNLTKFDQSQLVTLGYSFNNKNFGFNTNVSKSRKHFRNTYDYNTIVSSAPSYQSSISYYNDTLGSLSLNYLVFSTSGQDQSRVKILSTSIQKSLTKDSGISFTMGRDLNKSKGSFFAILSYNINLGTKSINLNRSKKSGSDIKEIAISDPIGKPIGWGYNASVLNDGKNTDYNVRVDKNMEKLNTSLYLYRYGKDSTQQLDLSGAIVGMEKTISFTAPINGSLALVKAGNLKNVPVYSNNQLIGHTNSKGTLLVPNVIPYVPSEISLDQSKLPIDTNFSTLTLDVAAPAKSGVVVDFEITKIKSATMILKNSSGQILPFDHAVTIDGIDEELFVGYYGQLFTNDVKGLEALNGKACDGETCCHFNAPIDKNSKDSILDLGEVICK